MPALPPCVLLNWVGVVGTRTVWSVGGACLGCRCTAREADVRDLQCPCGITLTGADDEELLSLGLEHADNHHPGEAISHGFIRNHITTQAVDAGALA